LPALDIEGDCSGLLLKEVGGKFTLYAPTKMVRQTLKMVGLDRFFGFYEDEASALES
jgi:anti-anti-sigma regulatory factor